MARPVCRGRRSSCVVVWHAILEWCGHRGCCARRQRCNCRGRGQRARRLQRPEGEAQVNPFVASSNRALKFAPSGRWTLRDNAAQRR